MCGGWRASGRRSACTAVAATSLPHRNNCSSAARVRSSGITSHNYERNSAYARHRCVGQSFADMDASERAGGPAGELSSQYHRPCSSCMARRLRRRRASSTNAVAVQTQLKRYWSDPYAARCLKFIDLVLRISNAFLRQNTFLCILRRWSNIFLQNRYCAALHDILRWLPVYIQQFVCCNVCVEDVTIDCHELRSVRYLSDGFCTSVRPIHDVVCTGNCLPIRQLPWYAEFIKVRYRV